MLPDRVSNPGPLTYESDALPIALRGPATSRVFAIARGFTTSRADFHHSQLSAYSYTHYESARNYYGELNVKKWNCKARQCSPLRPKFMDCSIINPALELLMKYLVIGQCQKAPNFSAFHWSPHGSLVSIGQHFVTTRVVHLPKRTETSLITESDRSGPGCAGRALLQ